MRRSLERADRIIAISHHTKRDLVETLSVDPERIWVVPFGVDPRIATTDARARWEAPRRVGIEGTYAIYPIGTLTPRKNIERTLRAFARAFPDPPDRPVLLLTGPETLPARERSLIEELGLEASVRVARVADGDALAALLAGARWGLYTSLYEGFGLPPLEAMAAGLPMLVSDRTALPEVVGEAAALVDPENEAAMAEAMRRLHVDPSLRETLQDRGRRRALAPAFSWERVARQTLAVYRGDRAAFDAEVDPLAREVSPSRAEEEWTR